ncbi:MAG: hypothetical protein SAK29_02540 [Scytonema sp. PMC 1069.18]|nr:hypothetical protein [Scytonema sp. PMC 1069.18]MEC4881685.1 hypothetical protein [Scytonema sp. PMC 1070.18]
MYKRYKVLDKEEIASLGASLRAIEQKWLKTGLSQGRRMWFQGDEPYFDIFFELNNNDIIWFEFTLRGKSLSWCQTTGWQTGSTNELKIDDVSFYPASKTIENDSKIDGDFINLVKAIFQTRAEEEIFAKALTLLNSYRFPNN